MTATAVTAAQADAGLWNTYNGRWIGNITYSVPGAGAVWSGGYGSGEPTDAQYGTFNTTQGDNFRAVMALWNSYIAPSLTEVSDATPGQIRVAFTDVTARKGSSVAAYAYGPNSGAETPVSGDIWVDESYKSATFARGSQEFELLIHESGHSLGLKHPFENPTLPSGYDNTIYSVMSYTHPDNYYQWYSTGNGGYGYRVNGTVDYTPMVLDIQAVQGRYGADPNTNSGNTTYAFTDADLNGRQAIYDAGGTDTIDLSALTRGSNLDLRAGAYSDLAYYAVQDQIDDLCAIYGNDANTRAFITNAMTNPNQPAYEWTKNLGISFTSQIENAIGTAFNDSIIGNTGNNVLNGGAGNDTLNGSKGNDKFYVDTNSDRIVEAVGGGTDYVLASVSYALKAGVEVEKLSTANTGSSTAIGLTGNEFGQQILGNQAGNKLSGLDGIDTLYGYGGNDLLAGGTGNDTLLGDLGNDSFLFDTALNASTNVDTIADFKNVSANNDTIRLENAVFTQLAATGVLASNLFKANATGTATDSDDRIIYETDTGKLFYDSNGNASGGSIQFAVLTGHPTLTAADFLVV